MTENLSDRVSNPLGLTAQDAIAGVGMGTAVPASVLAMLPPGFRAPRVPTCHRCGAVATVGWQRQATDDECEQHWAALEAHIREQPNLFDDSNASYTADRSQPVTKAVHGCDEHDLSPDPADDTDEAAVAAWQAGVEARTLTHEADCGGHGECRCGGETA